ncbi:MAG: hypothetical protein HQL91_13125 [Magnetococcales bacterium]|nr:hypothetical protein [Magnetococcales bacterium]
MLHAIEQEITIPLDGRLPESFRMAFGQKARVVIELQEAGSVEIHSSEEDSDRLMRYAGTVDWPIEDPVVWQRQQRSEWDRPWDR